MDGCDCEKCPLYKHYKPVPGVGSGTPDIVIVGEYPQLPHKRDTHPISGNSKLLLEKTWGDVGGDHIKIYYTNVTLCKVPRKNNKRQPPCAASIKACNKRLIDEIKALKPKIVIGMGSPSMNALGGYSGKFKQNIGEFKFNRAIGCYSVITYHPAACLGGATHFYDNINSTLRRAVLMVDNIIPFPEPKPVNKVYITSQGQAYKTLKIIESKPRWAIDLETDGFYFKKNIELVVISDGDIAYVFENSTLLKSIRNKRLFRRLIKDKGRTWILQNGSFDFKFLHHHYEAIPYNFVDTMCLAIGITEMGDSITLDRLCQTYLNEPNWKRALDGLVPRGGTYADIPRDILVDYAARDGINTFRLEPILRGVCRRQGTLDHVEKYLMPMPYAVAKMEMRGFKVDLKYVHTLKKKWVPRLKQMQEEIVAYARDKGFDASKVVKKPKSKDLNPNSPAQLCYFIFDMLGLKLYQGRRTTDKDFLEDNQHHEFIAMLKRFRKFNNLYTKYINAFHDFVYEDQRVRPSVSIKNTVTGRMAIYNPPLQTQPSEQNLEAWGFDSIKKCYKASKGHTLVDIDYGQLEVRFAWHYSGDKELGKSIMSGDVHKATASKAFKLPIEEVTKYIRGKAKAILFGVMYGKKKWSLKEDIKADTLEEAQKFIDDVFEAYPDYHKWWLKQQEDAIEECEVVNYVGRKRRWSIVTRGMVGEVRNQSVNFPIQSLNADLTLYQIAVITRKLEEAEWGHIVTAVHDSLVFEIKTECLAIAIPWIKQQMLTMPFESCAEYEVSIDVGENWGELTKWEEHELHEELHTPAT